MSPSPPPGWAAAVRCSPGSGADPFGDYVVAKLQSFGVDTTFVGRDDALRTPLAFAALTPPEDPELLFYRVPKAPDMQLQPGDVDHATVRRRRRVVGRRIGDGRGTGPLHDHRASSPSAPAVRTRCSTSTTGRCCGPSEDGGVRHHRGGDRRRRPSPSATEPSAASPSARTIRDGAADALLARGVAVAVVKLGGDGVLVATAEGRTVVPPRPVEVVCGLGAGDAFGGAFVHGLLAGWPPARIVEYANAAGAIVAGRLLCADAMPTETEIDEMLQPREESS